MKVYRFDDVALGAKSAALVDITVSFRSRQNDYWNRMCARIGFAPPQDFQPIDLGSSRSNSTTNGEGSDFRARYAPVQKRKSRASAPSRATRTGLATLALLNARTVSSASLGLSSTNRISRTLFASAFPDDSSSANNVGMEVSRALASFSILASERLRAPRSMSAT